MMEVELEKEIKDYYQEAGLDLSLCTEIDNPLSKEIMVEDKFISIDDLLVDMTQNSHIRIYNPGDKPLRNNKKPFWFSSYNAIISGKEIIGLVQVNIVENFIPGYIDTEKALDNPIDAAQEGLDKYTEGRITLRNLLSASMSETKTKAKMWLKNDCAQFVVNPKVTEELTNQGKKNEKRKGTLQSLVPRTYKTLKDFSKGLNYGLNAIFAMPKFYSDMKTAISKAAVNYVYKKNDVEGMILKTIGFGLSVGFYASAFFGLADLNSSYLAIPAVTNYISVISQLKIKEQLRGRK